MIILGLLLPWLIVIGLIILFFACIKVFGSPVKTGNEAVRKSKKIKGSFGPFSIDIDKEPSKK